ncbi:cobalamin biosynthesis protein CobG [Streptomyces sp. BR123]|uniref:cobalamin biosynthesis protein CobG n=1 Tax=Streptomyces sp. BR123 TaxID=2749828 RepID=UPI00211B40F5|nr:cobalamin biosynthesis protein CobG [Streptomyces sp. BR123]
MPTPPSAPAARDEPVIRERGDACPGALRLHAADDGYLARVRIPGGMLGGDAALLLADAADRLGDGHIDLTSRGNAQLRGLGASCGGELAAVLDRAGLLPAPTHERVRNIVASPLTGLDLPALPDVAPWVAELDRLLCAEAQAAALSGRFLFALDDGRGDVASLDADVTVVARDAEHALVYVATASAATTLAVTAPAATASAATTLAVTAPAATAPAATTLAVTAPAATAPAATASAVRVAAEDVPRAALAAARYFLDAVRAAGTRAWRAVELPAEHALTAAGLAARLEAAGIPATAVAAACTAAAPEGRRNPGEQEHGQGPDGPPETRPDGPGPEPGIVAGPGAAVALSVLAPLGRLTTAQWRLLAGLTGRMRLTPWRGIVVPGVPADRAPQALAALAEAGLVTAPDDPWRSVTACTGQPGCARSLADVRADARAVAARATGPLPVHWSGCDRRCGHPRGTAWVDVVATPAGYDLTVPGGSPPHRGIETSDHLAAALASARRTTSHDDAAKK